MITIIETGFATTIGAKLSNILFHVGSAMLTEFLARIEMVYSHDPLPEEGHCSREVIFQKSFPQRLRPHQPLALGNKIAFPNLIRQVYGNDNLRGVAGLKPHTVGKHSA